MTRNCLNVMQKYANIDKEAGAWDDISAAVMRRFPKASLGFINNLASKLYARRASRALIRREGNSIARAQNTLARAHANPTAVPPRQLARAKQKVRDARFLSSEANREAHAFNQQFNGPDYVDLRLPNAAQPGAKLVVSKENYVTPSMYDWRLSRTPVLTDTSVGTVFPTQANTYNNAVIPSPFRNRQNTDFNKAVGHYVAPGVSTPGWGVNVTPHARTQGAKFPDPIKQQSRLTGRFQDNLETVQELR
jgi:hypothetical protein